MASRGCFRRAWGGGKGRRWWRGWCGGSNSGWELVPAWGWSGVGQRRLAWADCVAGSSGVCVCVVSQVGLCMRMSLLCLGFWCEFDV